MKAARSYENFQDYLDYLESVKRHLSKELYDFATDIKNYDLTSPTSLHDAWVEDISINEISSGERQENRSTEVKINLLGPHHDRNIILTYGDVLNLDLKTKNDLSLGWGDLMTHDIRFDSIKSCLVHELSFVNGSIEVSFQDFKYEQDIVL